MCSNGYQTLWLSFFTAESWDLKDSVLKKKKQRLTNVSLDLSRLLTSYHTRGVADAEASTLKNLTAPAPVGRADPQFSY